MINIIKKCENLPVGAIATAVGMATVSNVFFAALGLVGVRHVVMICASFVWLAGFIKIVFYRKAFWADYSNVVPASLYATFTMLTMILGNYVFSFNQDIGRVIWLAGVILHLTHILVFTYRNVLKGINLDTFVPSWFVTFVAFLVSAVVGADKGMPWLMTGFLIYGLTIYAIIFPCMIVKVAKVGILPQFELTRAIFLAPPSLVFVTLLNAVDNPPHWLVFFLYSILFATILYMCAKIPVLLSKPFNPGHAALTFPTAIALVATFRMAGFLLGNGYEELGQWVTHMFGLQLWVTAAIMAYVAFGYLKIFVNSFKTQEA